MSAHTPSSRRRRLACGAFALTVVGGLFLGDVATSPSATAAANSAMPGETSRKHQKAMKALKAKNFGFFGTHGANLAAKDFTNPRVGGFVYTQYIGSEGAPPVALGYRNIAIGDVSTITPQSTVYVEATAREAQGVVLKNKTVWSKVKNKFRAVKKTLWGTAATPEMKVSAAIESRLDPDSFDAQTSTYRKYSVIDGEDVVFTSTWNGRNLVSSGLEDPKPADDLSHGKVQQLIGTPGKRGTKTAYLIPSAPTGDAGDPILVKNAPKKPAAFNGADFATHVTATDPVTGIRTADLWENSPGGPNRIVTGRKLLPQKWAKKSLADATKFLMTRGQGRTEVDYGLLDGYKVYRADFDGYTLELLVKELQGGAEVAVGDPWLSQTDGPLGKPKS